MTRLTPGSAAAAAGGGRLPLLLAHRGGAREAPENTLAALAHAVACGADGVEIDVRLSADGVPVVFHDDDLGRFDRRGERVEATGTHELLALDLGARRRRFRGERIPTLAAALAVVRDMTLVDLELKPSGDARRLAAAVAAELERAAPASPVVVTSFDPQALAAMAAVRPDLALGYVLDVAPADDGWLALPVVSLSLSLARADYAARARAAGLRVLVWTENDARRLAFWRRLGVEAVITDRPARLVAARALTAPRAGG